LKTKFTGQLSFIAFLAIKTYLQYKVSKANVKSYN